MTVYKPIKPLAEKAARVAVALAKGEKPSRRATATEDNGKVKVPTLSRSTSSAVTDDNVKDTVVKDGYWTRRARSAPGRTPRPARSTASSKRSASMTTAASQRLRIAPSSR